MREQKAFLNAIFADPDDLSARLVYADWLDENGQQERAEFIRAQCLLAELPVEDSRRDDPEVRSDELLAAHGGKWLGELPKWVREKPVTFRGGFPYSATMTGPQMLRSGAALLKKSAVQSVRLNNLESEHILVIKNIELMRRVRSLDLWNCGLGPWGFRPLLAADTLGGLRRLQISYASDTALPELGVVLSLTCVQSIRELAIGPRSAGDLMPALATLNPRTFPSLRSLQLHGAVSGHQVGVLGAMPFARQLTRLEVRASLDADAVAQFARQEAFGGLRRLWFGVPPRPASDVPAVVRSEHLRNLAELTVNHVAAPLTLTFEGSPMASSLRVLRVRDAIPEPGTTARMLATPLPRLAWLDLPGSLWKDDDVRELAASPNLPNLRRLDLYGTHLTESSLRAVAESPHLPKLSVVRYAGPLGDGLVRSHERAEYLRERYGDRFAVVWQLREAAD